MKLGFIGLGAMGEPMALNLLQGGHELHLWARRPEAAAALVAAGAAVCTTPAQVGERADVVFTMVTTGSDVEQVVLGPEGLVHGFRAGAVLVDCSTIAPETTRRVAAGLAARGIHMLDAPVSGGEPGAREGTLSIMVGGPQAVFEELRPLLGLLGKTLVYIGEAGAGQVAKAANQLNLVVTIQAVAEAFAFAEANGVNFRPVWQALTQGFAGSRMLEIVGSRMMEGQFDAGIDARLHRKDAHIVLECATQSRSYVPAAALAAQTFNALMARGQRRWDSAATRLVLEGLSGLGRRPSPPAA